MTDILKQIAIAKVIQAGIHANLGRPEESAADYHMAAEILSNINDKESLEAALSYIRLSLLIYQTLPGQLRRKAYVSSQIRLRDGLIRQIKEFKLITNKKTKEETTVSPY